MKYTDAGKLHILKYDNCTISYYYYIAGNIKSIDMTYYYSNSMKSIRKITYNTSASLVRKYDITILNKLVFYLNNMTIIC